MCDKIILLFFCFFFQAEDGIRDLTVTGVSDVCSSDLSGGLRGRRAPCAERAAPPRSRRRVRTAPGTAYKCPREAAKRRTAWPPMPPSLQGAGGSSASLSFVVYSLAECLIPAAGSTTGSDSAPRKCALLISTYLNP